MARDVSGESSELDYAIDSNSAVSSSAPLTIANLAYKFSHLITNDPRSAVAYAFPPLPSTAAHTIPPRPKFTTTSQSQRQSNQQCLPKSKLIILKWWVVFWLELELEPAKGFSVRLVVTVLPAIPEFKIIKYSKQ